MKRGQLIVLEGPDASGKKTQSEYLVANLRSHRIEAERISFPDYDSPWGQLVREYLDGHSPSRDPAFAAVLYAADRNQAKSRILDLLANETWVICDRYVPSSLAHMVGNWQSDTLTADGFSQWIRKMEYEILGLPKQDMTILLNVPFELNLAMAAKRKSDTDRGVDIHEEDVNHLQRAYDQYQLLAKQENWPIVECAQDGQLLAIEVIADKVFAALKPLL